MGDPRRLRERPGRFGDPDRPPAGAVRSGDGPRTAVIRPRRPADVPAVCALLAQQQATSGYPYRWPLPMPVEQFVVRDGQQAAWVAERGGALAGHVSVGALGRDYLGADVLRAATGCPDPAVVSVLFTGRDARRQGLGGRLLATAVDFSRGQGRVPVLDVLPAHAAALALYRARGWVQVGAARFDWLPAHEPDVLLLALPPFRARPTLG